MNEQQNPSVRRARFSTALAALVTLALAGAVLPACARDR